MPVRPVEPADVPHVHAMIVELAEYERSAHEVVASPDDLHRALFTAAPALFGHVATTEAGEVVGYALWFLNYSTWLGRHGIYLEDLYVRPQHRGDGHGLALLATLARECVESGYGRLEWWVLDWNEPALGFYRSIGAEPMDEWTVQRVTGDALTSLAERLG